MKTTGHHTCRNIGTDEEISANGPFMATLNNKGESPFLGVGYYYWDNNIEQAHTWGLLHCSSRYAIIESELQLTSKLILDLVGNRAHQLLLVELAQEFSKDYNQGKRWELGRLIDFLRELSKEDGYEGIFPFLGTRAVDFHRSREKQFDYFFVRNKPYYTNLNPCFVICLFELSNLILQTKTIVFKN